MNEPERFLVRLAGGPLDGITLGADGPWPLPAELPIPSGPGRYVKVSESQMPPIDQRPQYVMRGAEYEWKSDVTP